MSATLACAELISTVIYKRNCVHSRTPGGYFSLEQEVTKARVHGFGHDDYIRLRDDYGQTWRGTAEECADGGFRYTFRSSQGKVLSGLADSYGIILRDEKGRTWRGFID
jgi:hypothetical protein